MLMSIVGGPIGIPPGDAGTLWKIILKLARGIKSFFAPPKKNETPDDVAERNRAFQMFCEQVNREAKQVEEYVIQQLNAYGAYLNAVNESEEYSLLKRYKVNMRNLLMQLDFLKGQIPGIINAEVSHRLSDTDGECLRIRRMLPGAEKEAQMQNFLHTIVADAMEKCADTTESIMNQMQEIFVEDLQECLDMAQRQTEKTKSELAGFEDSANEAAERIHVRTKAEQIVRCSELVSGLFSQEV